MNSELSASNPHFGYFACLSLRFFGSGFGFGFWFLLVLFVGGLFCGFGVLGFVFFWLVGLVVFNSVWVFFFSWAA